MRELILGTAGHIDHGKTALVRALTGIDTDRLTEEKQRGISIDLGFAHLELDGLRLGIVDVPGHERFIKNMLAGASGIDIALLVVAADDSVMPQTREHLAILELLRIERGVIALTKCDLAEPGWIDLVEEDVRELVAGTFLADAPIVRTAATEGAGMDELKQRIGAVGETVSIAAAGGLFRLAVDRSFVIQGLGTVVTGTVSSGEVAAGDEIEWQPAGKRVRVREIQRHGSVCERVAAGQRAALNLGGVHHTEISRGDELAHPGLLQPSRRIAVRLDVLESSPWPIRHRGRVRLHVGTQVESASVRLLECNEIAPGSRGLALLTTTRPIVSRNGQPFVIRSESPMRTLGGGVVLQPTARRARRGDAGAIEQLERLHHDDAVERVGAAIFLAGTARWGEIDLCRDAGIEPAESAALLQALETRGEVVTLARGMQLHRRVLDKVAERITTLLGQLHAAAPLQTSFPRPQVIGRLPYLGADVVDAVIDRLLEQESLLGDRATLSLPGAAPALTETQQRLRAAVLEVYGAASCRPPDLAELARRSAARPDQLQPILELCAAQGDLVRLDAALYIHKDVADDIQARVTRHLESTGGSTVSELKDLLGTSRKYAVPICEYLDRIGLTRRDGDRRVLR